MIPRQHQPEVTRIRDNMNPKKKAFTTTPKEHAQTPRLTTASLYQPVYLVHEFGRRGP